MLLSHDNILYSKYPQQKIDFAAFCSFGTFWIGFAWTLTPASGVAAAYTIAELDQAYALYFSVWALITFVRHSVLPILPLGFDITRCFIKSQ